MDPHANEYYMKMKTTKLRRELEKLQVSENTPDDYTLMHFVEEVCARKNIDQMRSLNHSRLDVQDYALLAQDIAALLPRATSITQLKKRVNDQDDATAMVIQNKKMYTTSTTHRIYK